MINGISFYTRCNTCTYQILPLGTSLEYPNDLKEKIVKNKREITKITNSTFRFNLTRENFKQMPYKKLHC